MTLDLLDEAPGEETCFAGARMRALTPAVAASPQHVDDVTGLQLKFDVALRRVRVDAAVPGNKRHTLR